VELEPLELQSNLFIESRPLFGTFPAAVLPTNAEEIPKSVTFL
jgi:hypothetical protein